VRGVASLIMIITSLGKILLCVGIGSRIKNISLRVRGSGAEVPNHGSCFFVQSSVFAMASSAADVPIGDCRPKEETQARWEPLPGTQARWEPLPGF
jgi:hypothetical protein